MRFSPAVDITGNQLPINEFSADIITDDTITVGKYASLYDEKGMLWARYRITSSNQYPLGIRTVRCQSDVYILERSTLSAMMYNADDAYSVISGIFSRFHLDVSISDNIRGLTISGYVPEQTARERLQWICFAIGAYVRTFFAPVTVIDIIDEGNVNYLQEDRVFLRPQLSYSDYVTSIRAIAYEYNEGTPETTDKWVQVGGRYYIQHTREVTLNNPNVPANTPENVIDITKLTLINDNNVSDILSKLAEEYFNQQKLTANIINTNADVQPADRVGILNGIGDIVTGYVKSMQFTFGKAAKAKITMTQNVLTNALKLYIRYVYDNDELTREVYYFPPNTAYEVQSKYIDITNRTRRIYLPLRATVEGIITDGDKTENVDTDIALELADNILSVYSVDSADLQSEVVVIG